MTFHSRIRYFIISLFLSSSLSFAQKAPGYLGKKNIISYRGLIGPGFQPTGPERNATGGAEDITGYGAIFGLFYENQLSYERVMTRRFSLRTSITQQSFHFGTSIEGEDAFWINSTNYDYIRLKSYIPGNALGVEIAARWYYKHFAPLGWYFELHVGYQSISYGDAEYSERVSNVLSEFTVPGGNTRLFPVGFGWGYQRIIEDKFTLGFGTQISLAVFSAPDIYGGFSSSEVSTEILAEAAQAGASSGRILPFFFTFGYLL